MNDRPIVVIAGGAALAIVVLALAGFFFGASAVILGLAAFTLIAVIASFWNSLRTVIGETKLSGADAYAIGAPRVEEEQKRAVLRALKDLEFERAVGKISEDDYKSLVGQYRREAKRLLRLLDEASAEQRARAEEVVEARLAAEGVVRRAPTSPPAPTAAAAEIDTPEPERPEPTDAPPPEADAEAKPESEVERA